MPAREDADLALLGAAAREAGAIAMRYFSRDPRSWTKEDDSPVSEADLAVDAYLKETLIGARPDFGWLSEESADNEERLSREHVFVVDPIDGTRSFLAGRDEWCIAIGIVTGNSARSGVVYNPVREEFYEARRGGGTRLNGDPLTIAEHRGGAVRIASSKSALEGLPAAGGGVVFDRRYVASLAYRFARVAAGEFDATVTSGHCRDWDLAAAMLLVEEAGGVVERRDGSPLLLNARSVRQPPILAGSAGIVDFLGGGSATEPQSRRRSR